MCRVAWVRGTAAKVWTRPSDGWCRVGSGMQRHLVTGPRSDRPAMTISLPSLYRRPMLWCIIVSLQPVPLFANFHFPHFSISPNGYSIGYLT